MGLGDLLESAGSGLGSLLGGGESSGGASSGGGLSALPPLLLLEGVKQGLSILGSDRQEELLEKKDARTHEANLEVQAQRDAAHLERLEKQLEANLQLVKLKQLSQKSSATQGNRAKVASSLINAAVQGGSAESQALTRAGQLAQNFRR